ncbi:MAG: ParB N-terminal domain-containing protein [Hyalangium sp.]|uniref:ParB N-terminal domain-containing protein n=1 Tax=Hyalangium sp. TaxID=2028555 RepID=UPI00389AB668
MDAENRVDGEDGKPDTAGESSSAPAQGEGVSPNPEPRAEGPTGQAILLGAGESMPGTPTEEPEPEPSEAAPEVPVRPLTGETSLSAIALDQVEEDATFRIRPEGEISKLATDVARLGQLFPVDVRPSGPNRYQIICGFRRVAALRFLKRDRVQARIHTSLSDEDALLLALAAAIHASPVDREQLEATRAQLEAQGRLSAATRDMLEKALATDDELAPESTEEEVDADELAADAAQRLGALNQDLSLLADVFTSLDESRRAELLMQLRYSAELVAYLEGL